MHGALVRACACVITLAGVKMLVGAKKMDSEPNLVVVAAAGGVRLIFAFRQFADSDIG